MSTGRPSAGGCLSLLVESVLLAQLLAGAALTVYAIYFFVGVLLR